MADGGYRIDGKTVAGEIGEAIGQRTLEASLDAIAEQIRVLVGAHQSAVSYIPDGDFTRASHATSFSEKYEKYKTYDVMPTGKGIWAVIFEKRITMRFTEEELYSHPRFKKFSDLKDERGLEHPPMPGWLAVPALRPNGEPIGVLQLSDRFDGDFTQEDEDLLVRLAKMVSAMFEAEYVKEELVQTQLALEHRTRELEASNRELEQFAYVASHDLQAPLREVSSFTQLLKRRYADDLDDTANQYMDFAVAGAQRMSQLIDGLLTYSRVGRGGDELEPTDLNVVVDGILRMMAGQLAECEGEVTRDYLPVVRANPLQLQQLFSNLINNGIKFRGEQAPRVHVSAERQAEGWSISVRDNGIGIDEKYQERVFDIFKRLHRRDEYPGTGIGLAVVRKIARRHGGEATLESAVGKGSTFTVTLADNPGGD